MKIKIDPKDLQPLTLAEEIKKTRKWVRWFRKINASDLDAAERCLMILLADQKRQTHC